MYPYDALRGGSQNQKACGPANCGISDDDGYIEPAHDLRDSASFLKDAAVTIQVYGSQASPLFHEVLLYELSQPVGVSPGNIPG
jgi:hypothetical protein